MDWILLAKYFILGLIQGISEPIPISSSGHLILAQNLFGLGLDDLSFEVVVNTASLLAVILVYRKDIIRLISSTMQYLRKREASTKDVKDDFKLVIYLIIGTIPAGLLGVLFNDFIGEHLKSTFTVGIALLVTAFFLFFIRNLKGTKGRHAMTWKEALLIGIGQAVALTPGVSRSGATVVTAMLIGMKRDTALMFSFLLYIPVSLGASVLEIPDMLQKDFSNDLLIAYALAFIASLVASFFALKWFIDVMKKGKLVYFAIYCLVIAIITLFLL
ncbi:undecaprenyl-diphosphate phosphatase [Terribacillus sp. DMT04]|uniref:undecaprenyl-diphosphate phosphatase n=1 Tax=Terribacillus sp. DMT04 TaxID=2850441 RepID=UPI001C2C5152|nr:undecaprenyl-diphosphate phosphatase [Terribacillus sp. DMT04]QXE01555.1 undecaprenyl-diphosphate phosphatase [Terribacillus sp. DMT04]